MPPEMTLVLLFTAATAVAIATRLIKVPYTVALVLAGLGLGATHVIKGFHLTKDLLYAVFLPGLLFEAAYHLKLSDFRKNVRAIFGLAVPGVVVAIGATATLLVTNSTNGGFGEGFGWAHAFVFAALISATDPIAVVALFKSLGAPKRLGILIEGESLVNDGTAVVLFTIVFSAVNGGHMSIAGGVVDFVKVVGVGVGIGIAIGIVASAVIRRVDDPMIEITVTTIAAYGSFVIAEEFHFSGVIATVTAGMLCGSIAAPLAMSRASRIAVESFWQYLAFALNSIVFLLIGLEVPIGRLVSAWRPILIAFVAVTAGRALVVGLASLLLRPTKERVPWSWSLMLTWGGLRGALSMVLALALPLEFPFRDLIVTMTFGVVFLSIVLQGVTAGPLLRLLKLSGAKESARFASERAELVSVHAALDVLDRLERGHTVSSEIALGLRAEYEARVKRLESDMIKMHDEDATVRTEELHIVRRQLLGAEKDAVLEAHRNGQLDDDARDALFKSIDTRLARTNAE